MHIDLMRDIAKAFPAIKEKPAPTSLRVWHCKYKTLAPIGELTHLKTLIINTLPDKDIEWMAALSSLEYLWIQGGQHLTDLSPIAKLTNLKTLSLSTPPSWDTSKKSIAVESLTPLSSLKKLEHVELFGVHAPEFSLDALASCKSLRSARFSKYPASVLEAFYQASKVSDEFAPEAVLP